ncbi:hypothetical protein VTN77DRAFT_4890 [Rasamsonia byssochlamydoides]|uniref:uncharacterized protein n=1 Tax=Rasamsonia byssochlamydoides TaxID=89139 RepID=UPI0037433BFD
MPNNYSLCPTSTEHQEVISRLLNNGRDISSRKGESLFLQAIELSYFALVNVLLATRKVDINSRSKDGQTPLSWAAEKRHEAVVKLLLENGANTECKDKFGWTPLSWAARGWNEVVVKLLLENGADIESKDNPGQTPLSLAEGNRHEAVVKLLLEKSAEKSQQNDRAKTSPGSRVGDQTS